MSLVRDPWLRRHIPTHNCRFVDRIGRRGEAVVYRVAADNGIFEWIVKAYPAVDTPAVARDQAQLEGHAAHGECVDACVNFGKFEEHWLLFFLPPETFRPAADLLKIGTFTRFQLACFLSSCAAALASMHDRRVAHRNLSPAAIHCRIHKASGHVDVQISDFSRAKFLDGEYARFAAHPTGGSSPYVAPEQRSGGENGTASDIYSLARVAYELWTGDRERDQWKRRIPPRAKLWPNLPRRLGELLHRSLSPWPDARPTAAEVYDRAVEVRHECFQLD